MKICTFSLLLMFVKLAFANNFFNVFKIIVKFCVFYIVLIFSQKNFVKVILKLLEAKRLEISKKVFCKCVLDFSFAPIKRAVFFIF
jgi:hypothetical protein